MRRHSRGARAGGARPSGGPARAIAMMPRLAAMTALAMAAVAVALGTTDAAAQPARPGAASPPTAGKVDPFTGPVSNGGRQNEMFAFLAAHAGQLVHLDVVVDGAVPGRPTGKGQALKLSGGCGKPTEPVSCALTPGMTSATYVILDVPALSGRVQGDFAVDQPVCDAAGSCTVVMHAVVLGGPGPAKEDDEK